MISLFCISLQDSKGVVDGHFSSFVYSGGIKIVNQAVIMSHNPLGIYMHLAMSLL